MSIDKTKEVIEGLIQDYTISIEKGQEHINLINEENVKLGEVRVGFNGKKQKEIDEMIRFNNNQVELILEEMIAKNQKLRFYKKTLKEYGEAKVD